MYEIAPLYVFSGLFVPTSLGSSVSNTKPNLGIIYFSILPLYTSPHSLHVLSISVPENLLFNVEQFGQMKYSYVGHSYPLNFFIYLLVYNLPSATTSESGA